MWLILMEQNIPSHTLRGCVDWNLWSSEAIATHPVTPFVGVWIETTRASSPRRNQEVTPFVGVWIETERFCIFANVIPVTPFVGVWIETSPVSLRRLTLAVSHPSWVCGLKLIEFYEVKLTVSHTLRGCVDWNWKNTWRNLLPLPSHPSWVCGLKLPSL